MLPLVEVEKLSTAEFMSKETKTERDQNNIKQLIHKINISLSHVLNMFFAWCFDFSFSSKALL